MNRAVALLTLTATMAGCATPVSILSPSTTTPTVTPVPTWMSCIYNWAYYDQPDLTSSVQQSLINAGISSAEVRVYDFGEDCIREDRTIERFALLETNFDIKLNVDDAADLDDIGAKTLLVMRAVLPYLGGGASYEHISLSFRDLTGKQGGAGITVNQAAEIEAQGLTGPGLMDYLQYNLH